MRGSQIENGSRPEFLHPINVMEAEELPTISGDSMADNKALFKNVFGSEIFEYYVGQLVLLSSPPPEFDPTLPPSVQKPKLDEIMKAVRENRELKLIETLKDRLQLCVEGRNNELENGYEIKDTRKSRAAASSAAVSYIKLQEHWKIFNIEELKDEETSKQAKEIQDSMLDSFWKMNVADIEMTVSHVCQAVLEDPSASKDVRRLRAKGMKKTGEIF